MFKKLFLFSCVLLFIAIGATAASAQKWVDLGDREVKDKSEQDTWHVGKGKGEFNRLKVKVLERPVHFYRVRVTFENGGTQEVEVRNVIQAGGESRAIDLEGKNRFIDKVDIWYEAQTVRQGRRSHVVLFGIR